MFQSLIRQRLWMCALEKRVNCARAPHTCRRHGRTRCFPGLHRGSRAGLASLARGSTAGPWERWGPGPPLAGKALLLYCLHCQPCTKEEISPVLKNWKDRKCQCCCDYYILGVYWLTVTLLRYSYQQHDISEFSTVIWTSNSKSFTSKNLQLSVAWKQV